MSPLNIPKTHAISYYDPLSRYLETEVHSDLCNLFHVHAQKLVLHLSLQDYMIRATLTYLKFIPVDVSNSPAPKCSNNKTVVHIAHHEIQWHNINSIHHIINHQGPRVLIFWQNNAQIIKSDLFVFVICFWHTLAVWLWINFFLPL